MRRKWMAALCVASLSMAMMTGCGNGSTQETAKETQTETQTQAETQSETQTETASETEKATETESETAKAEKAAETEAKEKTMYVSGDVYMREAADKDAKAMTVLATGKEITVLGEEGDWYQVKVDDKEGYVVKKYITDSKEEAEAAAAAQQAAEAAAQQAAEQAAQQAAQQPSQSAGGKTEVSRQAYDDCDGSGHGYYEITYSDGSTAIEEY
ncbi:SH3 domain-containing protein [Faecalicatena sp. BF-R-105]|nr:SH3 domain-containing protein [Faecalicatena sp. BF-R-105]